MKKKVVNVFGKEYFLLGSNNGTKYYLQKASWDCDWYWGLGYVNSFTNNKNPENSRDISTHNHFDNMIFNKRKCCLDAFKEFFDDSVLLDKEVWILCELMQTAYTMRKYSDMLNRGGSHITQNPLSDTIKNEIEYNRINNDLIPAIMNQVYQLLSEDKGE